MGSTSELSLDYKPNTSYPLVIQKASAGYQPAAEQTQKIEDFLTRREEEQHKIEAFKRELPLCMQLLNNAMETFRQQLGTYQKDHLGASRPVMEEFIPFSNMSINGAEKMPTVSPEKASWMVSAQLWSPAVSEPAKPRPMKETECSLDAISPKLALESKQRNGGAFLPFSKENMSNGLSSSGSASRGVLPELALASSDKLEMEKNKCLDVENGGMSGRRENVNMIEQGKGGSNLVATAGQVGAQGGTHRKPRRCWSPDLHRRFVNALQMLGGSQVATPKQIRELMKVDGLTNDEVKSHLQKYRLHTRRPIPQPQPTATAAPQLVVLSGIWVPPEYATSAAAGHTIYNAHPQAHYDFYAAAPPHHHHLHHLHRGGAVASSTIPHKAQIHSPQSELRSSGGEQSESIQEEDDDQEGHGREEEEEEEGDEEDQMEKDKGTEKQQAFVPVAADQNNGCTDVVLKF